MTEVATMDGQPALHAPTMPATRAGWEARLSLEFEQRGERTVLARRQHRGPLAVQRPFYPERDGSCHVIVLHPPGGVAGGDSLAIEAWARPRSRVLLTSPAAQKLYRSFGRRAALSQHLHAAAGSRLQWLPLETIAFDGVDADSSLDVELAADASFIGWDVTCLGRPAAGEQLTRGRLRQRWSIRREGHPLFHERAEYRGGSAVMSAHWGLGGQPVVGLMVCADTRLTEHDELADELRTLCDDAGLAVSQLGEVLLCRYLGPSVERAQHAFRHAWNHLRLRLWQAETCTPRIWLT